MSFFSRILPRAGSSSPEDERKARQDAIEKLCSGLLHAALLEDRRASAQAFKAASKHYQLEIGTIGMPCLISSLRRDHEDVELTRSILETFISICSGSKHSTDDEMAEDGLDQQFCEMFLKDKQVIDLVLACSEERNVYVCYAVVQLLSVLEEHLPDQLPNAILSTPSGLSRLLDLLEDDRDIIRNDAVLLLERLTRTNPEIQKIAVFESIFERSMDLALNEGGVYSGGMIVEDALKISHNLLRHNPSNQNYFRESACLAKLAVFIAPPPPPTSPPSSPADRIASASASTSTPASTSSNSLLTDAYSRIPWSERVALNLIAVLQVVCIIAHRDNPKLPSIQDALLRIGLFEPLLRLALTETVPTMARAKSLEVLDRLMFGNQKIQALFTRQVALCGTVDPRPIPVVLSVISTAVESTDFKLRLAAANAIGSYLAGNAEGQLTIAATFKSPKIDGELSNDEQSAGSIIVCGTLDVNEARRDRYHVWFSQILLSHVLRNNEESKTIALRHQEPSTDIDEAGESATLLSRVVLNLIESSKDTRLVQTSVAYLMLLATWMHGFPLAVSAFLSEGSNVQFLIELLNQNSTVDGMIQGCTAFVFGLCVLYHDMSEASFSRSGLQDIVKNRIGVDVFSARLLRVRDAIHAFLASNSADEQQQQQQNSPHSSPHQLFDTGFADLFLENYDQVLRAFTVKAGLPTSPHGGGLPSPLARVERGVETDDLVGNAVAVGDRSLEGGGRVPQLDVNLLHARIRELESDVEAKEMMLSQLRGSSPQTEDAGRAHSKNLESKCAYLSTENERLQKLVEAYSSQLMQIEKEHEELLVILASYDSELKQLRQHLSLAEERGGGGGDGSMVGGGELVHFATASDVDLNLPLGSTTSAPETQHTTQNHNDGLQIYTPGDGSAIPAGALYQQTGDTQPASATTPRRQYEGAASFSPATTTHEV